MGKESDVVVGKGRIRKSGGGDDGEKGEDGGEEVGVVEGI